MTRAEIIARLRAGEVGAEIDSYIYMILHPNYSGDFRHLGPPAYTTSVDAAIAAPTAEGWSLEGMGMINGNWRAVEVCHTDDVDAIDGDAPTLAPAIMVAKLLTFEVGE